MRPFGNNSDYITPEDEQRIGTAYDVLLEAAGVLCDCAQMLDVIKTEWSATNDWSEWDDKVRDRITEVLKKIAIKN